MEITELPKIPGKKYLKIHFTSNLATTLSKDTLSLRLKLFYLNVLLSKLVRITCSCWKYSRVPIIAKQKKRPEFKGNHCGECYPCIMRRIAVKKAGLSGFDDQYLVDIFRDYPPEDRKTFTLIADLLRFAYDLKQSDVDEIFVKYPDFSIDIKDVEPARLVEMYKHFATETIETFNELGSETLKKQCEFLLR